MYKRQFKICVKSHVANEAASVMAQFGSTKRECSSAIAMLLQLVFEHGEEETDQLTGEPALTGLSGLRTTTSRSVGLPSSSTLWMSLPAKIMP